MGGYVALSRFLRDVRFATRFYRLYRRKFEPTLDGLTDFIIQASQRSVDILACREVRDEILARAEQRRLLVTAKAKLSAARYAVERERLSREMEKLGRALAGHKQGRHPGPDRRKRVRRRTVNGAATEAAVIEKQRAIEKETGRKYGSWSRAVEAVAAEETIRRERPITGSAIEKRMERLPPEN
ncbi:MAG TPA: hypothetical protein VGS98_02215 [Thermoanaerobaculia bacterium]|nr:hypothetical protein [Thermoanaerobaculia bacterium]